MYDQIPEDLASNLLTMLASAIAGERRASAPNAKAESRAAIDDRLEALALLLNHGVIPSEYQDERAAQAETAGLAKLFRAGGTY